ncbi:MAG: HyaD/HybD family hydrogenase maturation endopeptidase [Anaerolineae bacterium]
MPHQNATHTLILGVGNLLLTDEGIGIHAIQQLQKRYHLPDGVQIIDGGTLGMDLLYYLEGVKNLLLIDAVETNGEPGTIIRLEGDNVPAHFSLKMSPHQVGVPDMLFAAKLKDMYPEHVVLLGVKPGVLNTGLDLSPPVAACLDSLVEQARQQLATWGVSLTPR